MKRSGDVARVGRGPIRAVSRYLPAYPLTFIVVVVETGELHSSFIYNDLAGAAKISHTSDCASARGPAKKVTTRKSAQG